MELIRHVDKYLKNPPKHEYRQLTLEEAKLLWGHTLFLTRHGTAAVAKITSIKTWKRRPNDCVVHLKHGWREYGVATYHDGAPCNDNQLLVELS